MPPSVADCQTLSVTYFFFTFGDGKCTAKFCLPQSTKKRSLSVWPYDNTGKQQCTAGFFAGSTICICARSHTLFLLMEINTCWKPLTNKKFTNRVWNAPSLMKYNKGQQQAEESQLSDLNKELHLLWDTPIYHQFLGFCTLTCCLSFPLQVAGFASPLFVSNTGDWHVSTYLDSSTQIPWMILLISKT